MERNLSAQACDSDDLAGDLNLSDQEDNFDQRAQIKSANKKIRKQKGKKANKYHVEVDTNVFEVKLACLKDNVELATGDAEICKTCKAVFNSESKITVEAGNQTWRCEFCNAANIVTLDEEEIPKNKTVSYLIEAAAQVEDKKMSGQDISVVFCLDISGSMCVSMPVQGHHAIKGDRRKEL